MYEFTSAEAFLKGKRGWLRLFILLLFLLPLASIAWILRPPLFDWATFGFLAVLALAGIGGIWYTSRIVAKQRKRFENQRVTVTHTHVERFNGDWTELIALSEVKKIVLSHSQTGEVLGLALEAPNKVMNLSTLERLSELAELLQKRLPNAEVKIAKRFPNWRVALIPLAMICGGLLPLIPRWFFPQQTWLDNFVVVLMFLGSGVSLLLRQNFMNGLVKQRRIGWLFIGLSIFQLLILFLSEI